LHRIKGKNVGDHKAAVGFRLGGACNTTFTVWGSSDIIAPVVPKKLQYSHQRYKRKCKDRGIHGGFLLRAQLAGRASPATAGSSLTLESLDMNDQGSQEHNNNRVRCSNSER
jgi:hypothetical protein